MKTFFDTRVYCVALISTSYLPGSIWIEHSTTSSKFWCDFIKFVWIWKKPAITDKNIYDNLLTFFFNFFYYDYVSIVRFRAFTMLPMNSHKYLCVYLIKKHVIHFPFHLTNSTILQKDYILFRVSANEKWIK